MNYNKNDHYNLTLLIIPDLIPFSPSYLLTIGLIKLYVILLNEFVHRF